MKCNLRLGILAIFLTFAHGYVIADTCISSSPCASVPCYTYDQYSSCWDIDLRVDFLYWKPCVDNLDYATDRSGKAEGVSNYDRRYKYKNICPGWEPGIRLTVIKQNFYCDWDLRASYTYINTDKSSSIENKIDGITALLEPQNFHELDEDQLVRARGSWDSTYHEWDILFAYDIQLNNCNFFSPFFGVAGIVLDLDLDAEFDHINDSSPFMIADWNSEYWGAGFRAGTIYEYLISDCLAFFSNISGSILVGEADTKHVMKQGPENGSFLRDFSTKEKNDCRFIPGFHLASGLIYDTCYCGYPFSFKLAYEFLNWYNIPSHRVYIGGAETGASQEPDAQQGTRTFGFHGLTAGLEFNF